MGRRAGRNAMASCGVRCWALVIVVQLGAQAATGAPSTSPAAGCAGASADIPTDNAAALGFFARRVVDPGAVGRAAAKQPGGFVAAEAFGARGDGHADDGAALQEALDRGRHVWLKPGGVYRVQRRLTLANGTALASDGSATLLLDASPSGFDNRVALRSAAGLYTEQGTGLRLTGDDISLSDVFIVKSYADDRYVIGIDVSEARRVLIRRVRLRGFSLAPGIVTVRSSDEVTIDSTLIHASCTRSTSVPQDIASFQITGISVDDSRVGGRDSTRLTLHNNVIADLRMEPLTYRREQTDGINFAASGTGAGSVLSKNFVDGVDEGVDLFGAGIEVRGNRIGARGLPVKLIHGARAVAVVDNDIGSGAGGRSIGIFSGRSAEAWRRVHDILIEGNRIDASTSAAGAAIHVDADGAYPPEAITLRQNHFAVAQCGQIVIDCSTPQCRRNDNRRLLTADGSVCAD